MGRICAPNRTRSFNTPAFCIIIQILKCAELSCVVLYGQGVFGSRLRRKTFESKTEKLTGG